MQGVVHCVGVDNLKAVDHIKEIALKEEKRTQLMSTSITRTPTCGNNKTNSAGTLKNLREAPNQGGGNFLGEITNSVYFREY